MTQFKLWAQPFGLPLLGELRSPLLLFPGVLKHHSKGLKTLGSHRSIERTVVISRDVFFDETISPARHKRLMAPLFELKDKLDLTERTQHRLYRQRLRSPRPEAMCSKQWEMYLVRLKQWEQRAQWEPKRQTGRRQEKMPSEVSRTSPSSEAGELDPRYARSPAPKPEPEPEEEQVPEGAGRFVTRSGRQWGLISNATTTMRRNLTIISVDLARTSTIHRTLESHSGLATPHLTRSLPLHPKQWGV